MGGPIPVRGFELEDHLAGLGTAQAFVAQGGARDVAAQPFELLALLGPTAGVGMQAQPLGTDTALGLRGFLTGEAQRGVLLRQHFLAYSGAKRHAGGVGRCV